jgi:glucose-1-phosphate cytidylyltransferase
LAHYKGFIIKEFFANYFLHKSGVTIDLKNNSVKVHDNFSEPWSITLVDTGDTTMTGGRIKRIQKYTGDGRFFLTYGGGLANTNTLSTLEFHIKSKSACTLTSVQPSGRFGALNIDDSDQVIGFLEKPKGDGGWINGGFFVCEPSIFSYIDGDSTVWEKDPM